MEANFLFSTTPAEIEHPKSEDLMPTDGMILKEPDLEHSNLSLLPLEERYDTLFESYESIKKTNVILSHYL